VDEERVAVNKVDQWADTKGDRHLEPADEYAGRRSVRWNPRDSRQRVLIGLTIEGVPMNSTQIKQAEILLGVCNQLNAGSPCAGAIICAAIGESTLTNLSTPNSSGYWGVLQGGSGENSSVANFPPPTGWNDSAGMATSFLQGGKGFQAGSAISLARSVVTDPGEIATRVEASGESPDLYGKHLSDAKAIIAAHGGSTLKGSIAGGNSGGSGTVPDGSSSTTYAFSISGTGNPDEDYWTGINRLAHEVNWYLFSNGEYLYYLDGQEMLAQKPAAYIDRVRDGGRFYQAQGGVVWDNTAFAFVSDHKRKFHAQRRTKVALAQSPTEGILQLICGINEILGGDVIVLSGFGPGDGRWIVGESRRSVFDVYSQLTLVPGIAPITDAAVVRNRQAADRPDEDHPHRLERAHRHAEPEGRSGRAESGRETEKQRCVQLRAERHPSIVTLGASEGALGLRGVLAAVSQRGRRSGPDGRQLHRVRQLQRTVYPRHPDLTASAGLPLLLWARRRRARQRLPRQRAGREHGLAGRAGHRVG
jgi:hypothetical protein